MNAEGIDAFHSAIHSQFSVVRGVSKVCKQRLTRMSRYR